MTFFGLQNLLEWSQSSGNQLTHLITSLLYICKKNNSGIARWKTRIEQGMREGAQSFYALPTSPHVHPLRSCLNPVHLVFLEASLHRHD